MPVASCPICHRPCPDSSVCQSCLTALGKTLRGVPELARELEVTVLRQSRINTGEKVRAYASGTSPILFHAPAAKVRDEFAAVLHGHVREIEEYLPAGVFEDLVSDALHRVPALRVGRLAVLIESALPALRTAPFLPDLVRSVESCTARVVRMIDLPADRTHFYVGPCPEHDLEEGFCGGDIWAWFPRDVDARPVLQCNECSRQWFPETWLRLGSRIAAERERREAAYRLARSLFPSSKES